VTSESYK